jgi:PAP2 superfamily
MTFRESFRFLARTTPLDMRVAFALVAASVALTAIVVAFSGLRFEHAGTFVARFGGVFSCLVGISLYLRLRMPENQRTIFLLDMVAIYVAMAVSMMIYQYALATFPAKPISQLIAHADHAVGFHWFAFASTVGGIHWLWATLEFCYSNWMREFVVALIAMAYLKKYDDIYEFTFAYVFAGMATLSVTMFLDSQSYEAVATYALSGFPHPVGIGPEAVAKANGLRAGVDRTLDFDHIMGLVCFPSFHAGSALLLTTATRNLKWLWPVFLVFNTGILLGTISAGGHNLMDLLGGCAFAICGLAAARALRRAIAPMRSARTPMTSADLESYDASIEGFAG